MIVRIPKRLRGLMREVLESISAPTQITLSPDGHLVLDSSLVDILLDELIKELCDSGFREDDEPNSRGLDLEGLIDLVIQGRMNEE